MCFRRLQKFIAIMLLASIAPACTLKVNEPPAKTLALSVNPVEAGCLSNIEKVADQYATGKISPSELNDFWNCVKTSFSLFLENTTGAQEDRYTPQELVLFLETYFLGGKKVTPALAREAMMLKQAIIGGSTTAVTRSELKETLLLIDVFQKESLELLPYLPFTLDVLRAKALPPDKFDETANAFHRALERVGDALSRSVGPYEFDSLERFLIELDRFVYGAKSGDDNAEILHKYINVIRAGKSVLISPPETSIGKNDWKALFRLAPRYYTLYLRLELAFEQPTDFIFGEELRHIYRLVTLSFEYLTESIKQHPNDLISTNEVRRLVHAIEAFGVLPFKAKTLEDFLPVLINKFFRDLERPVSAPQHGINLTVLNRLWNNFVLWSEGQFYIEGLYLNLLGPEKYLTGELTKAEILAVPAEEGLKWTNLQNEISLNAIHEMRKNIANIRTFFPKDSTYVFVPENQGEAHYTLSNLGKMSLFRTGGRLAIQGYASDPLRAKLATYITQKEIMELYQDAFPLVHDLGLLDNPNPLSISNRIVEADLFLPSAEGDSNLSQDEATELLAVAVSAFATGEETHKKIAHKCLDKPGSPIDTNLPSRPVPPQCYFNELRNGLRDYWSHVPGLVTYFESLKNKRYDPEAKPLAKVPPQQEFLMAIDSVVRKLDEPESRDVLSEDSTGYMLISYYVEYLFDRYDMDHSGTLSKEEAWRAYPVFRDFIALRAQKSGLTKEDDYKALFHYLLKYQRLPDESLLETIRYFWNRYFLSTKYETDRLEVARLFSRLLKL